MNARHFYVGHQLEWAKSQDRRTDQDSFADSIAPVLGAGLGEETTADADLGSGLRVTSTPGHVSLIVETSTEPIVITGDLVHHPFQLAHPQLREVGDCDGELARRTRSAFPSEHAAVGSLLVGTHFPIEPVGRIDSDHGSWRFVPEPTAGLSSSRSTTRPRSIWF